MSEKVGYTAIPFDESQVPSERDLPPYSEKPHFTGPQTALTDSTSHECCYQRCHQRKKTWRKFLFAVLILFLGGRFLLAGLSFFMFNDFDNSNFDDQYIWIQVPGLGPHHEPEIGSPEMPYSAPPPIPNPPESPECEPKIKWNGPSELLLDRRDVSGLIFNIKGISAHGSVVIRQGSKEQDYINITNTIRLSEDSLQKQVDIKIDIIDEDYSVTVESPSFDGPRPTQKCVQVDTIITFPNDIQSFRSLLVDVPNSWILVENLEAINFAYVNLKSGSGHIKVKDISAAISDITTVNGHIQGGFIVSESLDVRTVNGAVGIDVVSDPSADKITVTAKSINGHLDVSVTELGEKQALKLKAGSVNGGVVANVPDTFTGYFSASTMIGYSYVEGKDITYIKKTRNVKFGYKGKKEGDGDGDGDGDDDDFHTKKMHKRHHVKKIKKTKKCHHGRHGDKEDIDIVLEAVTGAVELSFL